MGTLQNNNNLLEKFVKLNERLKNLLKYVNHIHYRDMAEQLNQYNMMLQHIADKGQTNLTQSEQAAINHLVNSVSDPIYTNTIKLLLDSEHQTIQANDLAEQFSLLLQAVKERGDLDKQLTDVIEWQCNTAHTVRRVLEASHIKHVHEKASITVLAAKDLAHNNFKKAEKSLSQEMSQFDLPRFNVDHPKIPKEAETENILYQARTNELTSCMSDMLDKLQQANQLIHCIEQYSESSFDLASAESQYQMAIHIDHFFEQLYALRDQLFECESQFQEKARQHNELFSDRQDYEDVQATKRVKIDNKPTYKILSHMGMEVSSDQLSEPLAQKLSQLEQFENFVYDKLEQLGSQANEDQGNKYTSSGAVWDCVGMTDEVSKLRNDIVKLAKHGQHLDIGEPKQVFKHNRQMLHAVQTRKSKSAHYAVIPETIQHYYNKINSSVPGPQPLIGSKSPTGAKSNSKSDQASFLAKICHAMASPFKGKSSSKEAKSASTSDQDSVTNNPAYRGGEVSSGGGDRLNAFQRLLRFLAKPFSMFKRNSSKNAQSSTSMIVAQDSAVANPLQNVACDSQSSKDESDELAFSEDNDDSNQNQPYTTNHYQKAEAPQPKNN